MTEDEQHIAYPLEWPHGWPRTPQRKHSRFEVERGRAAAELVHALELMGCKDIVISSNVQVRRDGLPLAGAPEPRDPGVAVYWVRNARPGCMACDLYRTTRENLRAVWQAVEAMRALKRSGATQVFEQAFGGLRALPANIRPQRHWRDVLGLVEAAGRKYTGHDATLSYRTQLLTKHPDHGGSQDDFVELQAAYEQALRELSV